MKRFAAVALAALMLLSVFAASASAADTDELEVVDTVEIRSLVLEGDSYKDIIETIGIGEGENKYIEINSTNFAGFYYDIDDDVKTETMTFSLGGENADESTIGEGALKYEIKPDD
ncbi:MAG: S-layer protein domain-containing protein, partial [Methanosarcinaceae archaeon]|nr:S-layer protein domain-containing protein [Methanosarcinaceae archaeon]